MDKIKIFKKININDLIVCIDSPSGYKSGIEFSEHSIKGSETISPILVDRKLHVIDGAESLEAAKLWGIKEVLCYFIEDLSLLEIFEIQEKCSCNQ